MLAKSSSAAAPRRTRHVRSDMRALFCGSGDDLLREVVQIGLQVFNSSKFLEFASFQGANASAGRCPQSLQLARVLRLALLHQPQSITQHLAGVLVASGLDEGFDELFLALCQHNISSWRCRT